MLQRHSSFIAELPPADIVIIHNIAWAHYKAAVFSELAKLCDAADLRLRVINVAATEGRRMAYSGADRVRHNYPHTILWNGPIEQTSFLFRTWHMISAVRVMRPRVLLVSGYYDLAYILTIVFGRLTGVKIIISVDSTEFDKPRHFPIEFLKRCILKMADAIFGYGSRSKAYCEKLGVPSEKIFIRCQAADHGITLIEFHKALELQHGAPRKNAFIYVGRLGKEKNVEALIEAFRHVYRSTPDCKWKLIIVGDGPLKPALEENCADLGSAVEFTGPVSWFEVPHYLARADVLVLPSKSEPWGLVVNEAMICGKAVIVSSSCGCAPDLVQVGGTGFEFDPSSVQQLSEIMGRFVMQPELKDQLGAAAAKLISFNTPATASQQMMAGINAVMPSPPQQ